MEDKGWRVEFGGYWQREKREDRGCVGAVIMVVKTIVYDGSYHRCRYH